MGKNNRVWGSGSLIKGSDLSPETHVYLGYFWLHKTPTGWSLPALLMLKPETNVCVAIPHSGRQCY